MIPAAMLHHARAIIARQLTATCTLTAPADTAGVQTWAGASATVACMKGNPGQDGGEDLMYEEVPASRFWVPVGTTVAPGYRLTWSGESGRTYQVVGLPSLHASELLRPVDCIEIRSPRGAV